jgi:hypothetical protein
MDTKIIFFALLVLSLPFSIVLADDEAMQVEFKKAEIINDQYIKKIRPIFQKKCFDCHSNQTNFPWYHSLPVIKGLLDADINEGRKHIDMSDDFPFEGHGSAEEDLKAIQKDVNENSMPPMKYWLIHWRSRLTKEERLRINIWIDESLMILKQTN